jgi:hypothetical protein
MDLWEFIQHPMLYLPPNIDLGLTEWKNWIDLFMQTNPWFCFFMGSTGMTWLTWLVMKTPWNWDNAWPDWVRVHVFKQVLPEKATKENPIILNDEVKE